MDQVVMDSQYQALENESVWRKPINSLIVSLVGCFMVVLSFYLFGALFRTIGVWYAWEGLTLAVGIAAVVLGAPGLRARAVHCMTVISVVLGAFVIMGTILLVVPVLWVGV